MYEYPIFKHLIQFSNLVDPNGKLMKGPDMPPQPLPVHHEYDDEEAEDENNDDTEKEGGEKSIYEGGDSEGGNNQ
jgi:hypothetical protein